MATDDLASATQYSELLIKITPELGRLCRVELGYTGPGSNVSTERTGRAIFDPESLRQVDDDSLEYGRRLSSALFDDAQVREGFNLALTLAGTRQLRLRLYIDSETPDLHGLRWELLRTPDDMPVSTGDRILFSRYLRSSDWRSVMPISEREVSAVVLIASPTDIGDYAPEGVPLEAIKVDEELARATTALGSEPKRALASGGTATLDNLIAAIREGCNLVYVVCHGAFVRGQARLFLESPAGQTTTVTAEELATEFKQLRTVPALVVLASCQSAGSARGGALSAVGPLLVQAAGVPSVLAMQERVSMHTSSEFVETFFAQLMQDGRLDRAAASARSRVRNEPDAWVPVLFSRIASGRMWTPASAPTVGFPQWPVVLSAIRDGLCLPIIGPGLIEFLLGPERELAQRWADTYHFPMSPHQRQDLPQVAQFLGVTQFDEYFPSRELANYLSREIEERYGPLTDPSMVDASRDVSQLVSEIGRRQRARNPDDPHLVLAKLPLPVYVTANPDNMLSDALIELKRKPEVEVYRWSEALAPTETIWDREPTYKPTVERPLVYHMFGHLSQPESLVLTEDNFFDFLLRVKHDEGKIPQTVTAAWSRSALLFLGFQIDEWRFRVLFRTIMSQGGRNLSGARPGVAVQIDPEEGSNIDPRGAKKYLEKYLGDKRIIAYWGNADKFARELWFIWQQTGGGRSALDGRVPVGAR